MSDRVGERRGIRRWLNAILSIPLAGKLAGANVLIVVVALLVAALMSPAGARGQAAAVITVALLVALLINVVLVVVALRPLRQLEDTVQRVWRGDLTARVPDSSLADRDMARVAHTLNLLLDGLTSDSDRMRRLARQIISSSDSERASVAHALHDVTAQALAALTFQASAAIHDCTDPVLRERLQAIRDLSSDVLDEIRVIGRALHPRVLDDLGLPSALMSLAREVEDRQPSVNVNVDVENPAATTRIPSDVASVLYHVAREGVRNALRHGEAHEIDLRVDVDDDVARLIVRDDGRGFDVASAEREARGAGLFGMRERLALIRGEMSIISQAGEGTRLSISVPLEPARSV